MKRELETAGAPSAIGPYSQAVAEAGWLYCSGQIAIDPKGGSIVEGGVEAETRQVLENLGAVLGAAGLDFGDVVKTTIFLTDLRDFEAVNRVYGERFTRPYPARSTVQVVALPRGARVEIEAIARMR